MVEPYVYFNGNALAAIEFYEKLASMNLVADGNFTAFLSRAWDKI